MEKVSAKEFFTVMWRGVCQAVGWFFGLFGFKRDGKMVKCVWGLFATSAAVCMAIVAGIVVFEVGSDVCEWLKDEFHSCEDTNCYENYQIYNDIYYHKHDEGIGYIYNARTHEKLVRPVEETKFPADKDSLVAYYTGKKWGYFSKYTGKVIVEAKYDHAWRFSEGLAAVVEDGFVKFIDGKGTTVIDRKIVFNPKRCYVFESGYCIVDSCDDELHGLMDRTGKMALPMEYNYIEAVETTDVWIIRKGREMGVIDKELKPIVPLMECCILIDEEAIEKTIDVNMPDHTMRKYDIKGNLINDFYITSVNMLEYETEEVRYRTVTHDGYGDTLAEPRMEPYHPKATARLRSYEAALGFEGLMTADGHIVTMPKYGYIEAMGYDTYLCSTLNGDKVVVNGKGVIVSSKGQIN
jgi:hypothetical protein